MKFSKPIRPEGDAGKEHQQTSPEEAFISASIADEMPSTPATQAAEEPQERMPWDGLSDTRVFPLFNLRLSEYRQARLKFVSENTNLSMHKLVQNATNKMIDEMIDKLMEEK